MQKRKQHEKFIDSILDHANTLQSLELVKNKVEKQISELSNCKKSVVKQQKKEVAFKLKSFYLLKKRIEIVLPSYIDDAIYEQKLLLTPEHERTDIYRYRCLSSFKLIASDLPYIKGYKLLVERGYYSQSNPEGVVKDHRLSIKAGFISKINPTLLSHPANCEFLPYKQNIIKSANSSINLEQLQIEIETWNTRINKKIKRWKTFDTQSY